MYELERDGTRERDRMGRRVCVKNDRLWYVWMTEATAAAATAAAAAAAVRWWRGGAGALVLGTNQYLTGGKRTRTRTDGKKAAWQPSAIPHRLILCCAPVYVFFFVVFNSNSRFILFYCTASAAVCFFLAFRPALTREPLARHTMYARYTYYYNYYYTNADAAAAAAAAPTEIFTYIICLKKTIV